MADPKNEGLKDKVEKSETEIRNLQRKGVK